MEYIDKRAGDIVIIESHGEKWVPEQHRYRVKHPSGSQAGAVYYISEERLQAQFEPKKVIKPEPEKEEG